MPEPLTETTPSRRSRPLLYVGAILWLLVAVSTFFLLQNRANVSDGQLPNGALSETELETGIGPDDIATHANGVSTPIPAEAIWDPQGIDDFELIDVDGEKVTKSHLLGKPWVVSFIFTRCLATCPAITASMRKLAADSKEIDVRFVSLSVDPNYDTPAVLKRYAAQHGAQKSRWLFLTGDQKAIYQLIYKSFKLPVKEITGEEREPGFQVIHSNFVLHVDSTGRVIGKYNGTKEAEMVRLRRKLAADQKLALAKKSNEEAEQIRNSKQIQITK